MKKIHTTAIAILFVCSILFCSLWIYEKDDMSEIEKLCQINAAMSLDGFKGYKETGNEGDYWYGVSDFKAFMNTWSFLSEESSAEYIWCNELYAYMILDPKMVQAEIDRLIAAMEIIGEDFTHPQGYHLISVLNNELKYD